MFTKISEWIISSFGEDKVKWIKGILAYFLIIVVTNFVSPFTAYINSLGWQEIWVTYTLIVANAGVMVLIAFIVFFLGKPIVPAVVPDIAAPPEPAPIPLPEPEPEPEPEIVPVPVPAIEIEPPA